MRTRIRTYRPDGRGGWLNATRNTPIGRRPPRSPWAVYLADDHGRYHALCFDFDAHHSQEETIQAEQDARECAALLERHGIGALTCVSGPSGGRHVWTASLDGLDPRARLLDRDGPETDAAHARPRRPCSNPRTGVRATPVLAPPARAAPARPSRATSTVSCSPTATRTNGGPSNTRSASRRPPARTPRAPRRTGAGTVGARPWTGTGTRGSPDGAANHPA